MRARKICTVCDIPKPLEAFYRRGAGRTPACKECAEETRRLRKQADAEESLYACTQGEVAAALGISKSLVGKIERSAMRKCRERAEELGLGGDLRPVTVALVVLAGGCR